MNTEGVLLNALHLSVALLLFVQISANLADRESRYLASADTVKKAEEKLQPVKVGVITKLYTL